MKSRGKRVRQKRERAQAGALRCSRIYASALGVEQGQPVRWAGVSIREALVK